MNHQLDSRLRHLRLSGMAATLEVRNQEAIAASLSHREFLELLVEDELNTRRDRLLARRIKKAGFPALKTLEDFDWSFNTSINKRQLFDLATARFMTEGQGIHLQGPPSVGKSHLAIALGIRAIHGGYLGLLDASFVLHRLPPYLAGQACYSGTATRPVGAGGGTGELARYSLTPMSIVPEGMALP